MMRPAVSSPWRIGEYLWAVIACAACSSCGSQQTDGAPVFPARGQVVFEGRPLAGASLVFHPQSATATPRDQKGGGPPAAGEVSLDDGSFVVSTYRVGNGLPAGIYRVTVSCEDRSTAKVGDGYPDLLPMRNQNPTLSGLDVTVTEGRNEFRPFELKR